MKYIKNIIIFSSILVFGNSAFLLEGIAVIDYQAIFLGTDLARERIDDLRESSDYKELTDEAQSKDSERIKLAEKLKKDEATLSDSEKEEMLKKIQTLYQSIQLLSQQIQAKEQEVTQKLQADQKANILSDEELTQRFQELQELQNVIRERELEIQRDAQRKQAELTAPIEKEIMDAINIISVRLNLEYVFTSPMQGLLVANGLEITDMVKKELGLE